MKKIILNWLFGTSNVKDYMDLLREGVSCDKECIKQMDDHLQTLYREKEDLQIIRDLIQICENHGINVDEEMKQVRRVYKEENE